MTLCQLKHRYLSLRLAEEAIKQRVRENPTLRGTLRPYMCGICGFWQITGQPDKNHQEDEAA